MQCCEIKFARDIMPSLDIVLAYPEIRGKIKTRFLISSHVNL